MTSEDLIANYQNYIDCLNRQAWDQLGSFVDDAVEYNGKRISLSGYRAMLVGDFRAIPDLQFKIGILASDPPVIACRLDFDCTPVGTLFGIPVNGKRVKFSENVFYEFKDGRIIKVHSLIDTKAIADQV